MEINRNNYEPYVLDYIEGNLPENMEKAVLSFLKDNPDLEEETKSLLDCIVTAENTKFDFKNSLKKNTTHIPGISKFEQLSVAVFEKDIDANSKRQLQIMLDLKSELVPQHQLIQQLKLVPDYSIRFKERNILYKKKRVTYFIPGILYYAAACIILVIGLSVIFRYSFNDVHATRITYNAPEYSVRKSTGISTQNGISYPERMLVKMDEPDSDSLLLREGSKEQLIGSLQIKEIKASKLNETLLIADLSINKKWNKKAYDEYTPIDQFLKHKFNEKILKQDKNEKMSFISFINAFGRFTNKVFHKKLEIEKTTTENGELLYAIKTDNFDFYTKRNPNLKNSNPDGEKNTRKESNNRKQ